MTSMEMLDVEDEGVALGLESMVRDTREEVEVVVAVKSVLFAVTATATEEDPGAPVDVIIREPIELIPRVVGGATRGVDDIDIAVLDVGVSSLGKA